MRSNLLALTLMSAASAAAAEAGATSDVSGTETGAQTDTQTDTQTQTGEVPSSTEPTAETKVRAPKDPSKALDILNGQQPAPAPIAQQLEQIQALHQAMQVTDAGAAASRAALQAYNRSPD